MNINEPVSVVGLHLVVLPNRLAPTSELSTGSWKTAGFAQQLWRGLGLRAPTRAPTGHTTRSAGPHGPHGAPHGPGGTPPCGSGRCHVRRILPPYSACIKVCAGGPPGIPCNSQTRPGSMRIQHISQQAFTFTFHCHEGASNAGQVSRSVWLR